MRKHNGMRPHDIVILLKIADIGNDSWMGKTLADELFISRSEVSESLDRSRLAGLLDENKRILLRKPLLEFLEHGFKYVFPLMPGSIVTGVPTAHSANPLKTVIESSENYVWANAEGTIRGQSIQPLHPNVVLAVEKNEELYELLALTDALRTGGSREEKLAIGELRKRIR